MRIVTSVVDPARAVDTDRLAALAVKCLELFVVADDLAQPVRLGIVGRDRQDGAGFLAGLDRLKSAPIGIQLGAQDQPRAAGLGILGFDHLGVGIDHGDGDGLRMPLLRARRAAFLARLARMSSFRSCNWPLRPLIIWRMSPIRADFSEDDVAASQRQRGPRRPVARSSI